jgi:hypothetical protein
MEQLTTIADVERLAARIDDARTLLESDECKKKEDEAREAYSRQVGLLERFFGFRKGWTAAACPVRDEFYTRLPEQLSLSPTVAFFLAADHQSFMSAMSAVQQAYDSANSANFKGMAVDLAAGVIKPTRFVNLGVKLLKSWSIMFQHMDGSDRAAAGRDKLASCILTTYRLAEIPQDHYLLRRGKWDVDSIYGQYTSVHTLEMTDNGIAEDFDFEKLKRKVDVSER